MTQITRRLSIVDKKPNDVEIEKKKDVEVILLNYFQNFTKVRLICQTFS